MYVIRAYNSGEDDVTDTSGKEFKVRWHRADMN